MQETVVPAPLLTAESHQTAETLASQGVPKTKTKALVQSNPEPGMFAAASNVPAIQELTYAENAVEAGVLELSGEAPTQQLQASQEMSLVTGNLAKADAHWLRDASSLSVDELALRLRRLDELEQQTQTYAQQLDGVKLENAALVKTAEQSLQWQYAGFGLSLLLVLAFATLYLRRSKPQQDAAASSILFGDNQSAEEEVQRRTAERKNIPELKVPVAEPVWEMPQSADVFLPRSEDTECILPNTRIDEPPAEISQKIAILAAESKALEALASRLAKTDEQAQKLQASAAHATPKKPWYQRLIGGKPDEQASFADSAAAEAGVLSDDERDERIDSVWEDSKDWLREERILAEREEAPLEAAVPVLMPLAAVASSQSSQVSESFFVDDIAPQPGQALIDYIRSLHRIVQRMLEQGHFGQAGVLLYEHVCLVPETSPWAYLTFLSLYNEPTAKYLDMRERFVARFGREAPHIGEEKSNLTLRRGISDYQYSMAQLTQSWPSERAVLLLEEWLAVSNKRIFTLNAYNELFMLYDVLEDLHGVSHGTNFQALASS